MIRVECEWDLGMSHGNQGFYKMSLEDTKKEVRKICENIGGIFETDDYDNEFQQLIDDGYLIFEEL